MQPSIFEKKEEEYCTHNNDRKNTWVRAKQKNRGTRGDSLLIRSPLRLLSRKPQLQMYRHEVVGACHDAIMKRIIEKERIYVS